MFHYKNNQLYCEGVSLAKLAMEMGTPLYVYSEAQLLKNFDRFEKAFGPFAHCICYALKANSNLSVARTLARRGAGADIVSGGELFRALKAGFSPQKIVFSGVGKTPDEMRYALENKILLFNLESIEEMQALNAVAGQLKVKAPIAIRVNPDVAAGGHHHISTGTAENKFGIHKKFIFEAYRLAHSLPHLQVMGLQAHIGSQIVSAAPFVQLLDVLLGMVDELARLGIYLRTLDVGGGLGISYNQETPPDPQDIAKAFAPKLRGRALQLMFEPGRFLVGPAGVLLTRVLYRKRTSHKEFVIVDAAMNDLARPALYDAYHEILPVKKSTAKKIVADVVGPICESGDYLAKARKLPQPQQNDLFAVMNAGAYGFAMSSQYNSRPRAAEILVSGNSYKVARQRETWKDLIRGEN